MTSTAKNLLCFEDSGEEAGDRDEDSGDEEKKGQVLMGWESEGEMDADTDRNDMDKVDTDSPDTDTKDTDTKDTDRTNTDKNKLRGHKGKTGVVYLSRIPPYMKPAKVKQILSRFGPVGQIYLSPEDRADYVLRKKSGGNRRKKFVEGWVEFVRKRHAKLAAETLNGKTLGGRKRSYYYDDILNVKYLSKFKWSDLTEQMALEAQERQERLRAEISQATRENRVFMSGVERVRLGARGKKERDAGDRGKEEVDGHGHGHGHGRDSVHFNFDQRAVSSRRADDSRGPVSRSKTGVSVLSRVFGS